jgi:hypothetical protein
MARRLVGLNGGADKIPHELQALPEPGPDFFARPSSRAVTSTYSLKMIEPRRNSGGAYVIKSAIFAIGTSGLLATSTFAQSMEKVDPLTGNYVPVRDGFSADDPTADQTNPNRLNNRVGQRVQSSGVRQSTAKPTLPPPAGPTAPTVGTGSQAAAPPISMSNMAIYGQPDDTSVNPFAKPDWWPK